MSHVIVSKDPTARNTHIPKHSTDPAQLSVRIGQMSFIQYGFTVDPGENQRDSFHPERVILLVLNNSRHVRYDIKGMSHNAQLGTNPRSDRVVIIGPWETADKVPAALSPDHIFRYQHQGRGARSDRIWMRNYYQDAHGNAPEIWDDALVFYDPSLKYEYEYIPLGGQKEIDDYRFYLRQTYYAYEWSAATPGPVSLLANGTPIVSASTTSGGGPQQAGGGLPYPPK